MEKLVSVEAGAVPIMRINIDTDQITPGPFMVKAYKAGWASALFGNWRFLPDGTPNPDFILNHEPWSKAQILLTGQNFGCGSSREIAPKALRDFGFRAIIAPSFAGIFYNNCFRNGLLPVVLDTAIVEKLAAQVESAGGAVTVRVDLDKQTVTAPDGAKYGFTTQPHLRTMLMEGLDEIAYTLTKLDQLQNYWSQDEKRRPWVYKPGLEGAA